MWNTFWYIGVPIGLLVLGFVAGRIAERNHFASIRIREDHLGHIPTITWDSVENQDNVARAHMATGSVVISLDYFKRFIATIRAFLGGEVKAYAPLLDRGRREAVLRMKEQYPQADAYVNLRVETANVVSTIPGDKNTRGGVEIFAYCTAIMYKR